MTPTEDMVRVAQRAYTDALIEGGLPMRAALTAALAAMWQPIETAPKDGTEIFLFTRHEADDYFQESFDASQTGHWDEGNHRPGTVWHREPGWALQKIGEPKAWMPLPPAPTQLSRGDSEKTAESKHSPSTREG
ncbi:MAG: hypothetical protein G4V63_29225 [Candidatus Afipia apatlaquensis]|uniref:DUF551 domain-containing protein n=1 Tax=Candidatus Afipia apatlaquensis TaxID=2712852 RepID=A0A7C9RK50_9BRAD|nr:hypothetical protein [Candidatus Afipia apatlaquensis]